MIFMSISPAYFRYLDHFGKTVPVKALLEKPGEPNMRALRHDVDHDLDFALEMSYWENQRGVQSTYYLLHTADYWSDARFLNKCLQIQDFGHEIGLHLNILSEWFTGEVSDVALGLRKLVSHLREGGVELSGISSHGDPLCYGKHFINYWCFSELKPPDPIADESGLSAEGIPLEGEKYQIHYPESHQLFRGDGEVFELWSISMKDLGLEYEAIHVLHDYYYTDSGGGWGRTQDPLDRDLNSRRHQILMHPEYWRGLQKVYFFLSTARSGSKWLANFLEHATPLKARHEFSLNHRYKNGLLMEEKHTADGFPELVERKAKVKDLLLEVRDWIEGFPRDYAEANVYLEPFLPELNEVFPDAILVHLYRNPQDVIRSIINRDWYDTPEENRHPVMDVKNWDNLSQFEKACWYVRKTNESLFRSCKERLIFEQMVTDIDYLLKRLTSLQIPVYPRLADLEYPKKINVAYNYRFPGYEKWPIDKKNIYHSICDPVNVQLGYCNKQGLLSHTQKLLTKLRSIERRIINYFVRFPRRIQSKIILNIDFSENPINLYFGKACQVKIASDGIEILPEGGRHGYFQIGGKSWYKIKKGEGWEARIGFYYRGSLDAEIASDRYCQLYCLMYDEKGRLVTKRNLGRIRLGALPLKFSFKVRGDVKRFNFAVYMSKDKLPDKIKLKFIRLEQLPLPL